MTRVSDAPSSPPRSPAAARCRWSRSRCSRGRRSSACSPNTKLLGDRPWGIGLLGFAPQALLDEQLASATAFGPSYAIIAGGRPDQAVRLEAAGVPTFLHVPSANLIPLFLQEGARRFIFEGRECGGHIGRSAASCSGARWSTA
jgi:NAD(P)H-dependent flavin oxidoreductase YrpB (nitropropane dioxygenase family)